MDSPVRQVQELLSYSKLFEPASLRRGPTPIEGLTLLNQLESLARLSLKPMLEALRAQQQQQQQQPQRQVTAPAAQAALASTPAPAFASGSNGSPARPRFGTARREYQPALQDSALVEALMKLQKNRGASKSLIKGTPQPGFSQAAIPQVEAAPKQTGAIRRPAEPCHSILQPKDPFRLK